MNTFDGSVEDLDVGHLVDGKDEEKRVDIAKRVGKQLCIDDLSAPDRKAAEALAWHLATDAIVRVRFALADAVKNARFLSKNIAVKIAHDVDEIACPFLEVTEIFDDEDWSELIQTVSNGALMTVARRTSMTEGLAVAIAEEADDGIAEALVDNPDAPMTPPVCNPIIDEHGEAEQIMDKMSERNDLHPEIAAKLIAKVSEAAQKKLSERYDLPDHVAPVVAEAETATIIQLIKQTSTSRMASVAKQLQDEDKLDHHLLIASLRDDAVEFFEAAMALLTKADLLNIKRAVRLDGPEEFAALLGEAQVPSTIHGDFWQALQHTRQQ